MIWLPRNTPGVAGSIIPVKTGVENPPIGSVTVEAKLSGLITSQPATVR